MVFREISRSFSLLQFFSTNTQKGAKIKSQKSLSVLFGSSSSGRELIIIFDASSKFFGKYFHKIKAI
jgi:hypothetical protein